MTGYDPAVAAAQRARRNGHSIRYVNEGAAAARAALLPIRELVEKWLEPTQPGVIHDGRPDAETYSAAEFINELRGLIYTSEELSERGRRHRNTGAASKRREQVR